MHNQFRFVVLATVLVAAVEARATPIFSDDFSTDQTSVSNDGAAGTVVTGASLSLGLGVFRSLESTVSTNTDPGDARIRTALHDGELTVSNDFEVSGLGSAIYTLGSPTDFSSSQSFQVDFLANDLPATVGILSTDSHGVQSEVFVTAPASETPFSVTIPNVFASNDASSISRIALVFGGVPSDDAAVTSFESVPEPASLGLLGLAGAGLLSRRRRR